MKVISSSEKCHKGDNRELSPAWPSAKFSSPSVFVPFHRNMALLAH